MALNLSTLTSPATSGDVLAEVLTTADFLEPTPVLRNLARGSNKGGDAKQDVALNQPKALPLIDGDGYLYASGVSGNYGEADSPILPSTGDFDLTIDFVWKDTAFNNQDLFAQYDFSFIGRFFIYITPDGALNTFWNGGSDHQSGAAGSIIEGRRHVARFNRTGNTFAVYLDGVSYYSYTVGSTVPIAQVDSTIGNGSTTRTAQHFKGAIFSVTEGSNTNIDFTAPNVRHGDTKFQCATGQVVTINQSGNDPATVVKKSVLRFDGANSSLQGLLNQTVTGGYMFAAFSVLGDGGESYGRIFGLNSTGGFDSSAGGVGFRRNDTTNDLMIRYAGLNLPTHSDFFDDERGDYLLEAKVQNGSQQSKVNNADADNGVGSISESLSAEEFSVAVYTNGINNNVALDLEYLALFPASITDAQADAVRNFINKRNNVFYRWDTDGYYFFDPQKATFTGNFTAVNTLDGYITGSDNGDTDVRSNLTLEQGTLNDQPSTDGYKITFNDSAEHLEFVNGASQALAGWQVVGTSLGTFVYKVNNTAVTELNLLGNLGNASYRQTGDLYGVILLPESATGADIEAARKLLIDRGAADGVTGSVVGTFWYSRTDIVDFKNVDFTGVTQANYAWNTCTALTSFDVPMPSLTSAVQTWRNCYALESFSTQLPSLTSASGAWSYDNNLSDFRTTDISNCSNFSSAWQGCSALTSFPADAKLGTDAENVNFSSAWRESGLTSLPALDLSKGVNFLSAFLSSAISSINPNVLLGTAASSAVVNFANIFNNCLNLTEVPEGLDLSKGNKFQQSFRNCRSLINFPPNIFDSIGTPVSYGFNSTWLGTVALNATSVENILVSINTSGQSAPSTGPQIHVDYNTATGSLSAATNSAIDSLKAKGWSIFINSVEQ